MSLQFGRWNLNGKPVEAGYLEQVEAALNSYGPDGRGLYLKNNISILYSSFHTTKESRSEVQPHICASGALIMWDGRLDNRVDLIGELRGPLTGSSADVAIVAAGYEKWATNCFGKLIGDWALSIWNPIEQYVLLAKDPIGTRHLYYAFDRQQITWSTLLDPLIRLADKKAFELDGEYVAGWISMFPAAHLTPCVGVHSVPPSSFVFLQRGKHAVRKYWDFDPNSRICYGTDAEYEEHFRAVFSTAVRRRLRSDRPVLAELSGGRDSSSIVCLADKIIALGEAECPRVDTISYYDDSEPNWNERPYFTKVEEKRGRAGWHIDVGLRSQEGGHEAESRSDRFFSTPGSDGRSPVQVKMCLDSQGNRVVLSGIGGDEIMGGVPTPIPELQDLLSRAHFGRVAHQLRVWALEKRRPWFHLFLEATRGFFPPSLVGVPKYMRPAPWLRVHFAKRHWEALTGYPFRVRLRGGLPSFQESMATLDALRRQLAHTALPFGPTFERRYPFLDRNLLEFIFAIPRDQLVRPKQRRSLMRRALTGIVPDEILNRKGKALVVRSPLIRISMDWANLVEMTQDLQSGFLGIVDREGLADALETGRRGEEVSTVPLMRTISVERWLRSLRNQGVINLDANLCGKFACQRSEQV